MAPLNQDPTLFDPKLVFDRPLRIIAPYTTIQKIVKNLQQLGYEKYCQIATEDNTTIKFVLLNGYDIDILICLATTAIYFSTNQTKKPLDFWSVDTEKRLSDVCKILAGYPLDQKGHNVLRYFVQKLAITQVLDPLTDILEDICNTNSDFQSLVDTLQSLLSESIDNQRRLTFHIRASQERINECNKLVNQLEEIYKKVLATQEAIEKLEDKAVRCLEVTMDDIVNGKFEDIPLKSQNCTITLEGYQKEMENLINLLDSNKAANIYDQIVKMTPPAR